MTQVVHEVSQALLFLFVQEIIIVHLQDVQCYKEAVHASLEFFLFPHCLPQKSSANTQQNSMPSYFP